MTYHKFCGLFLRHRAMLLITTTMAEGVYALPGGRPTEDSLDGHLHTELGITVKDRSFFGTYRVISNIDDDEVKATVFWIEGWEREPLPRQPNRDLVWAKDLNGLKVSTSVEAVWGDASQRGLVG